MKVLEDLVVIAIGKNEGKRLLQSLASIAPNVKALYVDSDSTDGSLELVKDNFPDIEILALSSDASLCAAKARNLGVEKALSLWPDLKYFQFLDADCRLDEAWLEKGVEFLESYESASAVCGFRREEGSSAFSFNRLCDLEWARNVGAIESCGGDFLIRAEVFIKIKGFRDLFTAGEEADLFSRMFLLGGALYRIPLPMTYHTANILSFKQWFQRTLRSGIALQLGARFYPDTIRYKYWMLKWKTLFWAFLLPSSLVLASHMGAYFLLGILLLYLLNFLSSLKFEFFTRKLKGSDALFYSFFLLLSKWPQAIGILIAYANNRHKKFASYR